MRHLCFLLIGGVLLYSCDNKKTSSPGISQPSTIQDFEYAFQNPKISLNERLDDLLGRLSVEEKISQLNYDAPAIERLGIPAYNWWNEALHGVARNGRATVF
ncbi:MAG: hypothetical protein MJA30_25070, partial [Cytophagales bacterium]|nr:hypothetical protein [Cytophagales bacterium]